VANTVAAKVAALMPVPRSSTIATVEAAICAMPSRKRARDILNLRLQPFDFLLALLMWFAKRSI
jgi:hypothetical protein